MNNIVLKKHILSANNQSANSECLDIIYGADENYQLGAGVSSVSLLLNNPNTAFRFHFFLDTVASDFLNKLKSIAEQFSTEFIVYELDSSELKKLPASDVWSSAMYFRLIALDYLSTDYEYALYLDADIICNSELNLDCSLIRQVICGVVADDPLVRSKSGSRLHIQELTETYFNSGVMFINLKRWKEQEFTSRCFELLSRSDAKKLYKYPDQDVLNLLLVNKQVQLDKRFNTIYTLKNELYDKTHEGYKSVITPNTALIHYTGITKPWHSWANYPSSQPFYTALERSPWSLNNLKSATKFVEKKKEYKHLLKQGKLVRGCISGIKYLSMKIIGVKL